MKTLLTAIAVAGTWELALAGDPPPQSWYEFEGLTGDWGGLRPDLEDAGISPFMYYDSIAAANVTGGLREDRAYAGQVYAGLDLDLEKLLGWQNTTMKISTVNRHGESVADSIGSVYDPMCIFGGQVTYLYQLFIESQISDEWSIKLGRVSADTDFANNDLYRYSLSTAINGPIRATLLENSITSFPYPVWGGRLKFNPSDEHQFQLGAYQTGDTQWDFTRHGLDFSIHSGDGVSVLAQYDWTPQVFDRPARFFIGTVNSFREFDDFDGAGTTEFLFRAYAHAEVEVIERLKIFSFASYSDQDEVAKTPLQISGGLNYEGLIPCRENDHTMFFATYGELSDEYGASIGQALDSEMVFELGHRIQVNPAFYVQPSVQYIHQPGGTGRVDDAVVLGAWIGVTF